MSEVLLQGYDSYTSPELRVIVASEGLVTAYVNPVGPEVIQADSGVTMAFETPDGALVFGSDEADVVRGSMAADTLYGGLGDDVLLGAAGDDYIFGGADEDILKGGQGNDRLVGNAGADLLVGNRGDDTLAGGAGEDTLIGGQGSDTYRLDRAPTDGLDVVKGFNPDEDILQISRRMVPGLRQVTLETVGTFDGAEGAPIVYEASTGVLWYNPTNGVAVPLLQLDRGLALTANDVQLY